MSMGVATRSSAFLEMWPCGKVLFGVGANKVLRGTCGGDAITVNS